MDLLSATLARVRPSPTVTITNRAAELAAGGADIIALSAGEPDFDTPPHIREAGKKAIDEGKTRYTAVDGIAELKRAICAKLSRENALHYEPAQISVSSGGKQVLYNALMASLDPGDEVLIPAPYWVSYPDMTRLAGGTPVILPCAPEAGFKLTPRQLAEAITPRSKWLILNAPSNPTGAAYTREELAALGEVVAAHPWLHVMSDEIYEHLVFDGFKAHSIAAAAPRIAERVLLCNGMSKAFAMTGWRIGYGAGPAPLIAAMRKIQSQSTNNPCSVSQWAAVAALEGPQAFLDEWRTVFARRRDLVVRALNGCEGIECPTPQGAFYVYPSIAGCIGKRSAGGAMLGSDEDFAAALLEEQGVAVVFGAAFGMSPAFRVSYAASDHVLEEACGRIARFCAGLQAEETI
ncbi:pyridoxal phosphate-dependent aminotransferase [Profundibacterium mesophilum]|uniref:Aminotransferase n=1 Tax=Profundibacterium mesophilum KAUST100406-0324 TaxID=1037889 RepID=A0A921TG07_9RHOB|nr:pyridoxal phosphate-dependent aminotransferase [Profundibacterium mesophilum]KAF0676979.1 Aminotransferase [Profundibacterium mesophilum KAUST100406-0324]